MDTEYEKQIKQGRDRMEVIASATMTIKSAISVVAETLITEYAPKEVEGAHTDIVDAGAHARSTCRQLADLAEQVREGSKGLGAIAKEIDKIEYGTRRLFADLIKRAEDEEQRRRELAEEERRREEERQQTIPGTDAPPAQGAAQTSSPSAETIFGDAPEGIVEQTAAGALSVLLEAARKLAREDASQQKRTEDTGALASALLLPLEMLPHLPVLFVAYEETWEATKGKKRKGRA